MPRPTRFLITCEHGGNRIPARWKSLFADARDVLDTHRGWDPGALPLARELARDLQAPLFYSQVSRLLVDLNRSLHNPAVYSDWTRDIDGGERDRIVEQHYRPHRDATTNAIASLITEGARVLHVSVHSFTPVLRGQARNCDIGLLYDPSRAGEKALSARWKQLYRNADQSIRVRWNYPYKGTSDGFAPSLRDRFPASRYLAIELELNHGSWFDDKVRWHQLTSATRTSLKQLAAEAGAVWR